MRTKTVSFGLFLFFVPILGITGLCYYYGMTSSLDSNGNPVSCEPYAVNSGSGVTLVKKRVPCGAPGAVSECKPYTHWQRNIDNTCKMMFLLSCILASSLLCFGLCKKINF